MLITVLWIYCRYGVFFLKWYSNALVKHAGDVLDAVLPAMGSVKVNGNSAPVRLKLILLSLP